MLFYHVTRKINQDSIAESGIDPLCSYGKRKTCWYVSRSMLSWAIAHVSAKFSTPVDDLIVYSISLRYRGIKKTRLRGVYQYDRVARPQHAPKPARSYLNLDNEPERMD